MTKHKIDLGLTAYDELFGKISDTGYIEVPIDEIDSFSEHTYKVRDDEEMERLVESIRENGVLIPVILREKPNGRYECISGHRRKRACEILGLKTLRSEIRELDDDAAIIAMVHANLHREHILPSEKAWSYRKELEAIKRQGKRTDLTSRQVVGKLETADIIGKETGESGRKVQRYIRLTYLLPALLDMVDDGKIKFLVGAELSYLTAEQQILLLKFMEKTGVRPSLEQAQKLHSLANSYELDESSLYDVFVGKPKKSSASGKDAYKRICKIVPKSVPADKTEDFIVTAIKYYVQNANSKW